MTPSDLTTARRPAGRGRRLSPALVLLVVCGGSGGPVVPEPAVAGTEMADPQSGGGPAVNGNRGGEKGAGNPARKPAAQTIPEPPSQAHRGRPRRRSSRGPSSGRRPRCSSRASPTRAAATTGRLTSRNPVETGGGRGKPEGSSCRSGPASGLLRGFNRGSSNRAEDLAPSHLGTLPLAFQNADHLVLAPERGGCRVSDEAESSAFLVPSFNAEASATVHRAWEHLADRLHDVLLINGPRVVLT